jgi:hypothetical protein
MHTNCDEQPIVNFERKQLFAVKQRHFIRPMHSQQVNPMSFPIRICISELLMYHLSDAVTT